MTDTLLVTMVQQPTYILLPLIVMVGEAAGEQELIVMGIAA